MGPEGRSDSVKHVLGLAPLLMHVLHVADQPYFLRREESHPLIFFHEGFDFANAEIVLIEISFPLVIGLVLVHLFMRLYFVHFSEFLKGFDLS